MLDCLCKQQNLYYYIDVFTKPKVCCNSIILAVECAVSSVYWAWLLSVRAHRALSRFDWTERVGDRKQEREKADQPIDREIICLFFSGSLCSLFVCIHPDQRKLDCPHVIESKWCWSFLSYKKVTNALNDMRVKYSFNLNLINVPEQYTAMYFPPHCNNLS